MRYYRTPLETFQRAFTLIELMVTLSVLGVILAIALPNLRDFVVGNRLSANVNAFIGVLSYARSEAIIRNQRVIVCAKTDGAIGCDADDFWGKYEIQVFVDEDGSGTRNGTEMPIKTFSAIDPSGLQFNFQRKEGPNVIGFQSGGLGTNTYRFDINVVNTADVAYEIKFGRTICISRPGRARVIPYTSNACPA